MSYLIDFIKQYPNDWEDRLNKKLITVKRQGDLAIFNYSILADFTDNYVREARGIIIDLDTMRVVAWPFTKFCNYGEKGADKIDWASAKVQQKVDRSIMKVWFYDGEWRVSTNGVIDAATAMCGGSGRSFKYVFDEAAANVGLDYSRLNKDNTYIFELVSKYNRVVIDYDCEPTLWHTGTRNNITGLESVEDIGVKHPAEYPLHSIDACIEAAAHLNDGKTAVENEGFVVVDANWARVKVKSPAYVAIHHLIPNGEVSDQKIVELIHGGDLSEILTYIPSLKERVTALNEKIDKVAQEIDEYCYWNQVEVQDNKLSRGEWARAHNKDKYFAFGVKYIFDGVEPDIKNVSSKKLYEVISKE